MNKQAAEQCIDKAKDYIFQKNWEKAVKFLNKGKRLDKSVEKEAVKLLAEVEEKKKMPTLGGKVYHPSSSEDFKKLLKDAGKNLVVIDFFANWCGPCKFIAPAFEKMATEHKDVVFVKVDVDQQALSSVCREYKVTSMPTFKFLKQEKIVDDMVGADENNLRMKVINNK